MKPTVVAAIVSVVVAYGYATNSQAGEDRVTYTKDIKPLVDKHRMKCHGMNAPTLEEFR